MTTKSAYELVRCDVSADQERPVERVRLEMHDGAIWRFVDDQVGIRCNATTMAAAIEADPALNEIRADQVTRITAGADAMATLPFLLKITGSADDYNEDKWSPAMRAEHIDQSSGPLRNAYRILYVNDERWGAFQTSGGVYLLPENDSSGTGDDYFPVMTPLAALSFSEEGGFSGGDDSELGSPTPGTVAWAQMYSEDSEAEVGLERRVDDAQTLVDWLLSGPFTAKNFWDDQNTGEKLITQLFADIAVGTSDGVRVAGDYLAAGNDVAEDAIGIWETSYWTLSIFLDDEVIRSALDLLCEVPEVADIVTAARDPKSPQAAARRAALRDGGLA